MSIQTRATRFVNVLVPVLLVVASGAARGDDTEIYAGQPTTADAGKPNILFVIDTSGSMDEYVATYTPSHTYNGDYDANRIYWRQGAGNPPGNNTTRWFAGTLMKCKTAVDEIAAKGMSTLHKSKMWNGASGTRRWVNTMRQSNASRAPEDVECEADAGKWGDGNNTTLTYAYDSGNNSTKWTSNVNNATSWTGVNSYIFYSGNYLNFLDLDDDEDAPNVEGKRIDIVRTAAINLTNKLDNVRLGLMRFSSNKSGGCDDENAEGGMVTFPVTDIEDGRDDIIAALNSYNASGCTPLSETLYEATQYFRGGPVTYGLDSHTSPDDEDTPEEDEGLMPSVPASRNPLNLANYKSPIVSSCQKNFVIYLTDGDPTADTSADDLIVALGKDDDTEAPNDFETLVGASCDGSGNGRCLDDLAEYLHEADLAPGDDMPGIQTATVYPIGFSSGVTSSGAALLQKTADRSGGEFFTATDSGSLETVLEDIVHRIAEENTNFTSPTIAVNAFNRTQNLDQLYIGVFRPDQGYHWPGNLKKYRLLRDGTIVGPGATAGQTIDVVNDVTGFFTEQARDYWSSVVDGQDVSLGGAANKLPAPADRKVYSNLSGTDLTTDENRIAADNASIAPQDLGLDEGDTAGKISLINWALGDADGNLATTTDTRFVMGDPVHSRPVTVIYGGDPDARDIDDAVVLVATNDGYLHAVDTVSGAELWAFMPKELMPRLKQLRANADSNEKQYGLDGNLRVHVKDVNGDGIIDKDDGDRVYVFFGMGRGGSSYYGLNITDKESPQLLWTRNSTTLPGIGQTWSTPTVTRVQVGDGSGQNADRLVLVFGGGYNPAQDNDGYRTDSFGNRIFMVDAVSGALLWSAGPSGTNLNLTAMTNSIPGDIRVLDLNNDRVADRMYAADMGGRVWRFDVFSGQAADDLVKGNVFASLGAAAGADDADDAAHSRRFYYAPDVALMRVGQARFFNIAIGSGWRGHPLDDDIQDRFYSLRDMQPFTKVTDYSSFPVITETNLENITDDPDSPLIGPEDAGWMLELREGDSGWQGEKVLAESRTFNGNIFFTTFSPVGEVQVGEDSCFARRGSNRLYVVEALDGKPSDVLVGNLDEEPEDPESPRPPLTRDNRFESLSQGGIAPEVVFFFPGVAVGDDEEEGEGEGEETDECLDKKCPPVICKIGVADCPELHGLPPRKTFWSQKGAD